MSDTEAEPVADPEADTEVLDEGPRSILLSLISQLRKGMDLHRVTLPTFVLEPRSMLERLTDFMTHADLLLQIPDEKDPVERFVKVVRYFLSGWHIRPKGVKKPYNPVLGEFFRCTWDYPENSTEAFFIAEQVSHHPPISAFYYASPENKVFIQGDLRPSSRFLGNSAATLMHGTNEIRFTTHPKEVYRITNPNVYARGLLFGTMIMELGDHSTIVCEQSDLICELEFTTKGFFSGTYNGIKGKIKYKSTGEVLYNLSGKWSQTIYIQKNTRGAQQEIFFDADTSNKHAKKVLPESHQEEYESRNLWSKLSKAIHDRDLDTATHEKTTIEDRQRKLRHENEEKHIPTTHRFFRAVGDGFIFKESDELFKAEAGKAKAKLKEILFPHQHASSSSSVQH